MGKNNLSKIVLILINEDFQIRDKTQKYKY